MYNIFLYTCVVLSNVKIKMKTYILWSFYYMQAFDIISSPRQHGRLGEIFAK